MTGPRQSHKHRVPTMRRPAKALSHLLALSKVTYWCPSRNATTNGRTQLSAKFRVTAGSTGMPGPVVVDTVIFFR